MIRLAVAILALSASAVLADDTPPVTPALIPQITPDGPAILFPLLPTPAKVPVVPVAPADPDAVPTLAYGQIYVVQSEVEFFLRAYPKGLVAITPPTPGPITVRGVFADGSGKVETRTFKGKYVAFVDAVEGVAGRVELVATPVGVTDEASIAEQLVDIGAGPRPPPKPDPDVPPVPPGPGPTPAGPLRIIMAYESSANMTREQLGILYSTKLTALMSEVCVKGADNRASWRKFDKDVVIAASEDPELAAIWKASKDQLGALPRLIIAVGSTVTVKDFPQNEAEALSLVKKIAEGK